MKQDQRSKTARVAAVMVMAKERGRPVNRKVARIAVALRMLHKWIRMKDGTIRCFQIDSPVGRYWINTLTEKGN